MIVSIHTLHTYSFAVLLGFPIVNAVLLGLSQHQCSPFRVSHMVNAVLLGFPIVNAVPFRVKSITNAFPFRVPNHQGEEHLGSYIPDESEHNDSKRRHLFGWFN
jgi:hypothetical protein